MRKLITVWERFDHNKNNWEFNHISNGYSENIKGPAPVSKLQKQSWTKATWCSKKAYLIDNVVIM